jgi:hypothetical protein
MSATYLFGLLPSLVTPVSTVEPVVSVPVPIVAESPESPVELLDGFELQADKTVVNMAAKARKFNFLSIAVKYI